MGKGRYPARGPRSAARVAGWRHLAVELDRPAEVGGRTVLDAQLVLAMQLAAAIASVVDAERAAAVVERERAAVVNAERAAVVIAEAVVDAELRDLNRHNSELRAELGLTNEAVAECDAAEVRCSAQPPAVTQQRMGDPHTALVPTIAMNVVDVEQTRRRASARSRASACKRRWLGGLVPDYIMIIYSHPSRLVPAEWVDRAVYPRSCLPMKVPGHADPPPGAHPDRTFAGSPFRLLERHGLLRLVTDIVAEDDALCLALTCRALRDALFACFPQLPVGHNSRGRYNNLSSRLISLFFI